MARRWAHLAYPVDHGGLFALTAPPRHGPASVLLADDDALVRSGLRALLDTEDDVEVVGEAATGREAISRARELRPDVILMDVRMPHIDGVTATREIVSWSRRPRVLVLTTFDLDEVVDDALDAGADGFLLKRATPEQLVDGVLALASQHGQRRESG